MAYERSQKSIVLGDSLDSFVNGISSMYTEQLATRNAEDELNFNKQVLEGNLSLDDQLAYRKEQLKRVSDDPTEKRRVSQEVASLTDRIEADKFTKTYTDQLTKYASGTESIDAVISWLIDQKASTNDPAIQSKIATELQAKQDERFTKTQQMLRDQTNYALNDKTDSVVGNQISRIQSAKASALLAGDNGTAASLDLQLQALQKAQIDNSISRDIKDMAVATATGFSHATDLLDAYNSKIQSAGSSTPVTVNGVTYSNAQQYWTYARDSYLADQGQGGFFPRIDNELTTAIKVKNSNNTLTSNDITTMASVYNNLYGRPELANFSAKLDAAKADTLQTAANFISDKIVYSYDNNNDLNAAFNSLAALKSQGVNTDAAYQKIMSSATSIQNASISEIVKQAQNLMQLTPGLTVSDAINQAVSQGYGRNLSPDSTLGKNPSSTAADILNTNQNKTGTPDNMNTIGAPGAPGVPAAPGTPASGGSYTIQSGDTLGALATRFGTTVQALAQLNGIADPNKIQAGASLKIPGASSGTPASAASTSPSGQNGLPSYAGAEITGQIPPGQPFVTVNGKNYAYVAPGSTQQPASTTRQPATSSTPSYNGNTDLGSSIDSLRTQIKGGQITPQDAIKEAMSKGGNMINQADLYQRLFANIGPITINGQTYSIDPATVNLTRTSTEVHNSVTSAGQGNTSSSTSAIPSSVQPPQTQTQTQPQSHPTGTSSPGSTPSPTYNPTPVQPTTPTTTVPASVPASTTPKSTYQGSSIVDYLSSVGKANDFTSRTSLAKSFGITNYTGSADQNLQLLKSLRGF